MPLRLKTFPLVLLILLPALCPGDDFLRYLNRDFQEFFGTAPLVVIGSGAVMSGAAMLMENPGGNQGFMGDGFLRDCSEVLDVSMGLPLLGGAALVWAGSELSGSDEGAGTGQMLTEGLLITYGITGVLKLGSGRMRPDGSDRMSFPSAHSAGTACTAVILWDRYGPEAGVPMAVLAAITALSRITLGEHYPSDVIAGSTLGTAVGIAVINSRRETAEDPQVQPAFGLTWSTESGIGVYF